MPISRPTVIPTPMKIPPTPEKKLSPLATQREKISFGIKPHSVPEKAAYSQKPRIVMHIKKGKVSYSSVSDKQSPVAAATTPNDVNKTASTGSRALVPYNDDDDDSDTVPDKAVEANKQKESPSKHKESSNNHKEKKLEGEKKTADVKKSKTFEPVFDKRLNATMALPGAYGSLDREVSWTGHEGKPLKNGDATALKVAQDDAAKLKHMIDHRLTVQVDSPSSKVNATTHWDIQQQDAETPSSVGSCSSSGSINSTTKWQVTPQRCQATTDGPLSPLEVACVAGFTVKTRLDPATDHTQLPAKITTPTTNGQQTTPVVTATGDHLHLPPSSSSHSSRSSSISASTNSVAGDGQPASVKSSSVSTASSSLPVTSTSSSMASSSVSVASSSGSGRKHKHKKHKKHKRDVDEEEDEELPRKKKKKKKKHKRLSRNDRSVSPESDASPDRAQDAGDASPVAQLVWVEKTKETIEREHKHHLVRDTDNKGVCSLFEKLNDDNN